MKIEPLSQYKMGWLMTVFDLPTYTKLQRRLAAKFRNFLLDDGFLMIQYSVYARPCVSYDRLEKHTQKVMANAPDEGNIKILFFTESQWKRSIDVCLESEYKKKEPLLEDIPQQALFW